MSCDNFLNLFLMMKRMSKKPWRPHPKLTEEMMECDHTWVGDGWNCGICGVHWYDWHVEYKKRQKRILNL